MIANKIFFENEFNYLKIFIFSISFFISIYCIWISRLHFLDDTFIHLRIANNILEKGIFSFNGLEKDFSSSSPLYTLILSFGLKIWQSPFLPKLINVIIYFYVYAIICLNFAKSNNNIKDIFLTFSILAYSSPLAVRWLTDGMESCLVLLFSIFLGNYIFKISSLSNKDFNTRFWMENIIINGLAVFLRVEFAFIILWSIISLETIDLVCNRFYIIRKKFIRIIFQLLPLLFSLGLLFFIFGEITPDTSIAKSGIEYNIFSLSWTIARSHLSSSFFGISLFIIWIFSFLIIFLKTYRSKDLISIKTFYLNILINFSMLFLIILIAFRGQMIQGIRYFIFIESFLITFNYLTLNKRLKNTKILSFSDIKKFIFPFLVAITLLWLIYDFNVFYRISQGRSETFLNLKNQDFSCYEGSNTLAWDVGMIGYFSKSNILDPNGLVNGREIAKLSTDIRLENFIKNKKIDNIFANKVQFEELQKFIDTSTWSKIGEYEFPNFRQNSSDTHYLLRSPNAKKCYKN